MSFNVNDAGDGLEVGPPGDDPTRQLNERRVQDLAYDLEMRAQLDECTSSQLYELQARTRQLDATVTKLAAAVSMLEALLVGTEAA
jgi:hypothetical protein